MVIERTTAEGFEDIIVERVRELDGDLSVRSGSVYGVAVRPVARVAEVLNERMVRLASWITLDDPSAFRGFSAVLESIARNEEVERREATFSTVVLSFSTASPPIVDQPVVAGTVVVGTVGGRVVPFVTSETRVLRSANAAAYLRTIDGEERYVLDVAARSAIPGTAGEVGARVLTRFATGFVGSFTQVVNFAPSSPAVDEETDAELVDRLRLAIEGRSLASRAGITRDILARFPTVSDVFVREAPSRLGGVDAFIFGGEEVVRTDGVGFPGPGVRMVLPVQPVVGVVNVREASVGGASYVEGTDYDVELGTSVPVLGGDAEGAPVSGSVLARSGVRFRDGRGPVEGTLLLVSYTVDQTVVDVQTAYEGDRDEVVGQELRVRRGRLIPVIIEAILTPRNSLGLGLDDLAESLVEELVEETGPGEPLELSDLNARVRGLTGVDNFVLTRVVRQRADGTFGQGASDLQFASDEKADLLTVTVTLG